MAMSKEHKKKIEDGLGIKEEEKSRLSEDYVIDVNKRSEDNPNPKFTD